MNRESIRALYETLFAPPDAVGLLTCEAMANAGLHDFSLGQPLVTEARSGELAAIVLLSGRVRVLMPQADGSRVTVLMLEAGACWGLRAVTSDSSSSLQWLGSETGQYVVVPMAVVDADPHLSQSYQDVMNQLNESLTAFAAGASPSSPTSVMASAPADSRTAKRRSQQSTTTPLANDETTERLLDSIASPREALFPEDELPKKRQRAAAKSSKRVTERDVMSQMATISWDDSHYRQFCLAQLLRWAKQPLTPLNALTQSPASMRQMAQMAERLGFITQCQPLNWKAILALPTPFVLEDTEGDCHWVIGHQGRQLIELDPDTYVKQPMVLASLFHESVLHVMTARWLQSPRMADDTGPVFGLAWLCRTLFAHAGLTSQLWVSSVLIQIFSLVVPLFFMVIFDRVFGRQNLNALQLMAVGVVIITVFEGVLRWIRSNVLSYQLDRLDADITQQLISRVMQLPLSLLTPPRIKALVDGWAEVPKVTHWYLSTALITSVDTAFALLVLAGLLFLNTPLALISLASLVPIMLITMISLPFQRQHLSRYVNAAKEAQMQLLQQLSGLETLNSVGAVPYAKWQLSQQLGYVATVLGGPVRSDRLSQGIAANCFGQLGYVTLLYAGAQLVLSGDLSYGVYMAINLLSRRVMGGIQTAVGALIQWQELQPTLDSMRELMSAPVKTQSAIQGVMLAQLQGALALKHVQFRYTEQQAWVLQDINIAIQPSQLVVLTGTPGSGKSSLLKLCQQLYLPQSGAIFWDGVSLTELDEDTIQQHIGLVLQRPQLFKGTIAQNIALGWPDCPVSVLAQVTAIVNLDGIIAQLPNGLDTEINPLDGGISPSVAGQIALARVLLRRPSVLLLDEVLAPLDGGLQQRIYQHILALYKDKTMIIVSKHPWMHQQADTILVMHQGRVVEQGRCQELLDKEGLYRSLMRPMLRQAQTPTRRR